MLFSVKHRFIRIRILSDAPEKVGQIKGFAGDAVLLQSDLIIADGFEFRGSCAQNADGEMAHTVYNAANGGEIVQILLEFF